MNSSTQKKLGVVLQYSQLGLSILISLLYTPIMLRILGKAEYGIYNLSSSIISYLSLLSLGLSASYIRFYTRYSKDNDSESISRLNGLFLMTFLLIGLVSLVCGIVLSRHISVFFNETYTAYDKSLAQVLTLFMSVNLSISFPISVFSAYVMAQERFVFQKILSMLRTVLGPFLTLPALLLGWGSIGMVVVSTAIGLTASMVQIFFCLRRLKMRFLFSRPDFGLLKEIAGFSIFIALNQVIDQINWATDRVILGKVCNSAAVAFYAIGAQINSYFIMFSTAISDVFVPQIYGIENANTSIEEKNRAHTVLMARVGRIQFMVLMLLLTGFIFFGKYFVRRWAGPDYATSYWVALLLMCPVLVPLIQNVGIEIQRAKNQHQFRSIAYLLMAIFNVVISVFFAKRWGEIGAALGTTISLVVANGIVMNIFYHRVIKLDMLYFWKEIGKLFRALILPAFCGIMLNVFYSFHSLFDFGICILLYTLLYAASMYVWGMNAQEKDLVIEPIRKVLRKNDAN